MFTWVVSKLDRSTKTLLVIIVSEVDLPSLALDLPSNLLSSKVNLD
jgi:hypothetical protein